ncbi:MAG: malto-oligosyltrehalose synthase [Gemmatimonadaceae bacterium]|nr:malto-oligosyltrehalose synthase [Gemmatimonadaceae bacterium]
MSGRPLLRATYRMQVNREVPLARARAAVPYLARLGISHLYLSPVLSSRPGSSHGYDVVDPTRLDPELGTDDDWAALVAALHAHGMGLLLDIVPNHMGVGQDNPFWDDLFANGPASPYAAWFDIDWREPRTGAQGRVLMPILGDRLGAVLARGEIGLRFDAGRLRVHYFDHSFPLDPATLPHVLAPAADVLRAAPATAHEGDTLAALLRAMRLLPSRRTAAPERVARRRRDGPELLRRLEQLYEGSGPARDTLDLAAHAFATGAEGARRMRALLDAQVYALVFWRRAAEEINYRRFFDINELVALRMEDPAVFAATHRRVIRWVREGRADALRVDHIDGLRDPQAYLERLRRAVTPSPGARGADAPVALFVEKVLSGDERLRADWPVQGTTGYELLNALEAIFIAPAGYEAIEDFYRHLIGVRHHPLRFADVAYRAKVHVLRTSLAADVRRLARLLAPVAARDPRTADLARSALAEAIIELIAALPVYRTYIVPRNERVDPEDRRVVDRALAAARERGGADPAALALLTDVLLLHDAGALPAEERTARARVVQLFQQTSGPAAAKGVEDTALYRYAPLASLDEVGGTPDRPLAHAVERLHAANAERAARWPASLLTVSTHDTKRSADVRARLDVLSELPDAWSAAVTAWRARMRSARTRVRGRLAPDAHTEYLAYQTIVGIWPLEPPDHAARAALLERVREHMRKAMREAKARTSWTDPDAAVERALDAYLDALFAERSPVLDDVARFAARIARPGLWNALARTLVYTTAPGTPDVYQGDELWNFTLVDPDNRHPVDFEARARALDTLRGETLGALAAHPEDGRLKLYVLHRTLAARRAHPALFAAGTYEPVRAVGARSAHVVAFVRRYGAQYALTVVPRFTVALGAGAPVGAVWEETRLDAPETLGVGVWRRCIGDGEIHGTLRLGDLLRDAPVELLLG